MQSQIIISIVGHSTNCASDHPFVSRAQMASKRKGMAEAPAEADGDIVLTDAEDIVPPSLPKRAKVNQQTVTSPHLLDRVLSVVVSLACAGFEGGSGDFSDDWKRCCCCRWRRSKWRGRRWWRGSFGFGFGCWCTSRFAPTACDGSIIPGSCPYVTGGSETIGC